MHARPCGAALSLDSPYAMPAPILKSPNSPSYRAPTSQTSSSPQLAVALKPANGSKFKAEINFSHPSIGQQSYEIELFSGDFESKISDARTFGFAHEVKALRAMGLALGGSLDNAVVLDEKSIMNPEGLRHENEFARHKVLDAVGDIYIAGGPMIGAYEAVKPGHNMNNRILQELFSRPDAWEWVDLYMDSVDMPAGVMSVVEKTPHLTAVVA